MNGSINAFGVSDTSKCEKVEPFATVDGHSKGFVVAVRARILAGDGAERGM